MPKSGQEEAVEECFSDQKSVSFQSELFRILIQWPKRSLLAVSRFLPLSIFYWPTAAAKWY